MSGLNAPEPTEHFLLADGEKKVEFTRDTKIPNTGVFTFNKEDHTLGNLLRCQLLRDQRVVFGGYRMPHPLVNHTLVRVSASEGTTPGEVTADAAEILSEEYHNIREAFHADIQRVHNELTSLGGGAAMGVGSHSSTLSGYR